MALHELRRTHLGPVPSEGARQAWIRIAELGWDLARLRREIQERSGRAIPSGHLTKYLYCDRRPGVLPADAFKEALGVEPKLWHEPPIEPFATPAARAAEEESSEEEVPPSRPEAKPHEEAS